jgi:hypothetical protein
MRRHERGLQVWLDYIYKLGTEENKKRKKTVEGDKESLNTEGKRGGGEKKKERVSIRLRLEKPKIIENGRRLP